MRLGLANDTAIRWVNPLLGGTSAFETQQFGEHGLSATAFFASLRETLFPTITFPQTDFTNRQDGF